MILKVRGRGEIEHRTFALTDMVRWGYTDLRNQGSFGEGAARGIPALHRAVRIRAEAVASLRLYCWRGEGPTRERVDNDWRARLFRGTPNPDQSLFEFWETVGESLGWRNNAYVWKLTDPATRRVIELWALHPDQVKLEKKGGYKVTVRDGLVDPVGRGDGEYYVGPDTILHIRGHGQGGKRQAPTPIEVFRDAIDAPIARQRSEGKMWRRGTQLQTAVELPEGTTLQDAKAFRDDWNVTYEGHEGETTAIVGGGASIKPIGMTARDAAFVELAGLTITDAALIMGVPKKLLEGQTGDQPTKLEEDLAEWYQFGLGPELERIEAALLADPELFGGARLIYPGFETEGVIRGDLATEDTVAHQRVQDGRLLVDEWRASKGLPPLPNGAGKVPQVVPVGGAPNTNATPEPATNGAGN